MAGRGGDTHESEGGMTHNVPAYGPELWARARARKAFCRMWNEIKALPETERQQIEQEFRKKYPAPPEQYQLSRRLRRQAVNPFEQQQLQALCQRSMAPSPLHGLFGGII